MSGLVGSGVETPVVLKPGHYYFYKGRDFQGGGEQVPVAQSVCLSRLALAVLSSVASSIAFFCLFCFSVFHLSVVTVVSGETFLLRDV